MKTKKTTLIAAAGVFLASLGTAASASDTWTGDVDLHWQDRVQSTKTRGQVLAELEQAREQGLVLAGEAPYAADVSPAVVARGRGEVRAEAVAAAARPLGKHDAVYLN